MDVQEHGSVQSWSEGGGGLKQQWWEKLVSRGIWFCPLLTRGGTGMRWGGGKMGGQEHGSVHCWPEGDWSKEEQVSRNMDQPNADQGGDR